MNRLSKRFAIQGSDFVKQEEIKYWSYGFKDGYIELWLDAQQRFIRISEKDLEKMMGYMKMYKAGLIK